MHGIMPSYSLGKESSSSRVLRIFSIYLFCALLSIHPSDLRQKKPYLARSSLPLPLFNLYPIQNWEKLGAAH